MDISSSFKPLALSLSLAVGLTACVYDPHYSGSAHRPYYPYYYPLYYDYYFYPSVQVYFHYSTGYYYYSHNKRWIRSKALPPHIHLDPRDRVITRIEGNKPYLRNKQHRQEFQPRRNYRPDPQLHRQEKIRNLKSYKQHQNKQKAYEEEWLIKRKRGKRPFWLN